MCPFSREPIGSTLVKTVRGHPPARTWLVHPRVCAVHAAMTPGLARSGDRKWFDEACRNIRIPNYHSILVRRIGKIHHIRPLFYIHSGYLNASTSLVLTKAPT